MIVNGVKYVCSTSSTPCFFHSLLKTQVFSQVIFKVQHQQMETKTQIPLGNEPTRTMSTTYKTATTKMCNVEAVLKVI